MPAYIPEGHHTVTPYLVVPDAVKLIDFMKQAFDAELTFGPMKGPDGRVQHAEMRVGDSRVMIGQACEKFPALPAMIYLYLPDCDATYKKALAAGATSIMEPADQFYGDRSGGVKDTNGVSWWLGTAKEKLTLEQIQERAAKMSPKK